MRVLGIVMEANPFHNGHKYFIDKCKKTINPDIVVAITSTSFTMRGEISLLNKFDKTEALLLGGADIVLELPFSQTVQSADYFASSSIKNLIAFGITDLAFGSEIDDQETLEKFIKIISSNEFNKDFENTKSFNLSQKETYTKILEQYLSEDEIKLFNEPNITLAIQYIKTLKKHNQNINYHIIKRINSHYHDKNINNEIASATAIRNALENNFSYENTLPDYVNKNLINIVNSKNKFIDLIKYRYFIDNNLNNIFGNNEGINNYIKKNGDFSSLNKLQESLKNKRYTNNRLNRIMLYTLLNIENMPNYSTYLRILGINQNGINYLSTLHTDIKKQIFSGSKEVKKQPSEIQKIYDLEYQATKLYSLLIDDQSILKMESKLPIRKE